MKRTDLSHTWPGKATLVKGSNGFKIVHLKELPYNKFQTEVYESDAKGVALGFGPILTYDGDHYKWAIENIEATLKTKRKPKKVAQTKQKPEKVGPSKVGTKGQKAKAEETVEETFKKIEYAKGTYSHDAMYYEEGLQNDEGSDSNTDEA